MRLFKTVRVVVVVLRLVTVLPDERALPSEDGLVGIFPHEPDVLVGHVLLDGLFDLLVTHGSVEVLH